MLQGEIYLPSMTLKLIIATLATYIRVNGLRGALLRQRACVRTEGEIFVAEKFRVCEHCFAGCSRRSGFGAGLLAAAVLLQLVGCLVQRGPSSPRESEQCHFRHHKPAARSVFVRVTMSRGADVRERNTA